MVCIAYNHNNEIISIVNAKSMELAYAYWHGASLLPHHHKTDEDFDFTDNGTGVVPILVTKQISPFQYTFTHTDNGQKLIVVK